MWVLGLLRNTVVLGVLCVSLLISTATLAFQTVALGAQLTAAAANGATATARAVARARADAAVERRKAVSKAVARTKAKARLRRALVAVPIVGAGAVFWFEARDFKEWQEENPGGTPAEYGCETALLSAEVMDEFLQDLPEALRSRPKLLSDQVAACEEPGL